MVFDLICRNCEKRYEKEKAFNKHKLICVKNKEELDKLEIRDVVYELIKKNQKLENDLIEIKRWVNTKKKKIIIIDWLNNNIKPDISFDKLKNNFNIDDKELEIIFETNIIDGINEIFNNKIKSYDNLPIKAFEQKDNTIYIYNEKWEILSDENYILFISNLYKQIMTKFKEWQDKNEKNLYSNDFSDKYIKYVKKIMGGDIPIERQRTKIHRNIYNSIKSDLKNTIEYEFT